jgi:hypothetical protein
LAAGCGGGKGLRKGSIVALLAINVIEMGRECVVVVKIVKLTAVEQKIINFTYI